MSEEVGDVGREQIEKAFVESENHEFNGAQLQPYSPARMIAAQAMGLHYGSLDPAGVRRFSRTKLYPGAVRDVAIILWLCSLKDVTDKEGNVLEAVETLIDRASRDPLGASQEAIKFATEHNIADAGTDQFWNAYMLFWKIMKEVEVSRVTAQKKMTTPTKAAKV